MSETAKRLEGVGRGTRHTVFGAHRGTAAACLIALSLLLASGHMNSFDGGSQLAQSVHFCATGHIGANHQIDSDFAPKDFRASTGTWYDSNDIGATLVMLPAACASVALGAHDPASLGQLTEYAKAGASLTFAFLGGIATVFVFLALSELLGNRTRSWWWSLVFLFGTGFLAYAKGAWNVLPAATSIAALAWIATRSLAHRDSPTRTAYCAAAAVAAASLCRYTLLPFLTIGAIAVLFPTLKSVPRRHLAGALLLLFALLLPTFAFNVLRSGVFWRPGQSAPQFTSNAVLHVSWSYWLGTTRMFFGFTRGLLFFAPVCLLAYLGAVIYIVRSSGLQRLAWIVGLGSTVAYTVTVCLLHAWAAQLGWGPRYLVPLFPMLFVVGVITIEARLIPRFIGYALAALGLLTQLPLSLANWHAVVAAVGKDPSVPSPIIGIWKSAIHGVIHGHGLGAAGEARSLEVPDVWWWHMVGEHAPHLVGLLVLLAAFASLIWLASSPTRTAEARLPASGALETP